VFKLHGMTPLVGDNSATGSSSSASYTVPAKAGSGYTPTDTYSIQPGGTFDYTGTTAEYTVPVGITQLKVRAIGGGTDMTANQNLSHGADITGTLAVTSGEKLLIGAAGAGEGAEEVNRYAGGWGMTYNGDNYSGGGVQAGQYEENSQPGGGATVVVDEDSGTVLVVAGGGGGAGLSGERDCDISGNGGSGGEGGSLTGGNGKPWPGGGGQAGANTSTTGQSSTGTDACAGGAGGGGVQGGLAGRGARRSRPGQCCRSARSWAGCRSGRSRRGPDRQHRSSRNPGAP
jgi:hypothetical protein